MITPNKFSLLYFLCSITAIMQSNAMITKQIEGTVITYARPRSHGRDVATYNPQEKTYKEMYKACVIKPESVSYYADPQAIYTLLAEQYEKQEHQKTKN